MKYEEHLLLFGLVAATAWFLIIYFWPRMLMMLFKRAILVKGFGDGPKAALDWAKAKAFGRDVSRE